jgi:hypothetical protein
LTNRKNCVVLPVVGFDGTFQMFHRHANTGTALAEDIPRVCLFLKKLLNRYIMLSLLEWSKSKM